jgi:hypothetical protein
MSDIELQLDDAYKLAMTFTSEDGKHVAALLSQARADLRSAHALDTSRSWRFALIAAVCLIVVVVFGGYIIYSNAQTDTLPGKTNAEFEYYRGVYDSCTAFITNIIGESHESAIAGCNQVTAGTFSDGWFKTDSVGFVSPVNAASQTPNR